MGACKWFPRRIPIDGLEIIQGGAIEENNVLFVFYILLEEIMISLVNEINFIVPSCEAVLQGSTRRK
jgi:hypothetical protein